MTPPGYSLVYHPLVVKHDIPRLGAAVRARVRKAIEQKLVERPELYGLPLRGTLAQLWKLRVGDYRVVYTIVRKEVRIVVIAHRRDVYDLAEGRL